MTSPLVRNENNLTSESGFSYIDVMVAITLLLVGLLALAGAIVSSMKTTSASEVQLEAKQYASSALESIFTARDLSGLGSEWTWEEIANADDGGHILNGQQPVYTTPGADGVYGTADDNDPDGLDNIPGTDDDSKPVEKFARQIIITNPESPYTIPNASIKSVTIIVYYPVGDTFREEIVTTWIAR
jgi:type II secretory pathway pseudopilin PulG